MESRKIIHIVEKNMRASDLTTAFYQTTEYKKAANITIPF